MQESLHPPVKVIVVILGLSPEVEEQQRQAESRHKHSKAGTLQLMTEETKQGEKFVFVIPRVKSSPLHCLLLCFRGILRLPLSFTETEEL